MRCNRRVSVAADATASRTSSDKGQSESPNRVGKTNLFLLEQTQEYLKALLEHQAPDSVLQESWDVFYELYNRLIRRFVVAHGVRHEDVDDCIQDVWSEVATRLVHFGRAPGRPGLRAWIYTVVRSKATNVVRQKTKSGISGMHDADTSRLEPCSREPDPAVHCERAWNEAAVHTLLEELESEVSQLNYGVVYLRFIERKSVGEVADQLGISNEQVRYRQHRMLKKLRAKHSLLAGMPIGRRRRD